VHLYKLSPLVGDSTKECCKYFVFVFAGSGCEILNVPEVLDRALAYAVQAAPDVRVDPITNDLS